ncbi:hypothetical protein UFOVP233_42 [uncultured Caudovirales phage]|uniref:Uncharacterized protein n=1 Tax=uncultured Caudovirales phage TaxID=2100421 RepID=A0A6J7WUD8_9CAUD|nr:hypothetical protein UFOVP233_42 [uncultured Caudovirales phage]
MTHPDRHPLDGNMIAADDHYSDHDNCPGCEGGDKWPEDKPSWQCPVCELIYIEEDEIVNFVQSRFEGNP